MPSPSVPRRRVLQGLAAGTGLALTGYRPAFGAPGRAAVVAGPGTRPDPTKPEGVDLLPKIEHIVIYMQENHSYDSYLGMLGRGDGYTVVAGKPTNANPLPGGGSVTVFPAAATCQTGRGVSQSWNATHKEINGGAMDGFAYDGNIASMKYWDDSQLPFYWSLAETFPLCDRWFGSAPCQTYPNRMYLQAATSMGLVSTDIPKALALPHPPNGTIWDKLNAHGISWADYAWDLPDIALFPKTHKANGDKVKSFDQFLRDCRSGALPAVSIVSPGVGAYSEENPHDVQLGEAYSSSIVNAVMHGPAWPSTVLLFTYDEHGGYYDHVPPPAAIPPDDIPPDITVPPDEPGAFDIYGPRVPGFVISPFSKKGYVSHVVHDHTSILKLIETKFNLGALTKRDANASNLLDSLDLTGPPPFLEPPTLAKPGLPAAGSSCEPSVAPPPTE
ncbi:MAG: Acid phosphatase, partial [Acidimicrobiales bacterium]|nr:Acid phosphatase [Acidimicrobiales bacterium]